jgi:hypothetical protein
MMATLTIPSMAGLGTLTVLESDPAGESALPGAAVVRNGMGVAP